MTLILDERDYFMNKHEIIEGLRGEMCKIMRIDDPAVPGPQYFICADITCGGWTTATGRRFHVHDMDAGAKMTGLGTFLLIRHDVLPDGRHLLEFTDDLNPDLP